METPAEQLDTPFNKENSDDKPTREIHISPEAESKLLDWNIPKEKIEAIKSLMEQSGSVSSKEKAMRIAANPPVIIQGSLFHTVAISDFHDISRYRDQNSADETKKLLLGLSTNNDLQAITESGQFQFRVCEGRTDKFFTNSRYVWLELSNKNSQDTKIYFDPTFGTVQTSEQSSNLPTLKYEPNPKSIFNYNSEIVNTSSKDELIAEPTIARGETRTKTLGFSEDRRLIYSLGYYRESGSSNPYIRVTDGSGVSDTLVALEGGNLIFLSDKIDSINDDNSKELAEILSILSQANIVDKSNTITENDILKQKTTIYLSL